GDDHAASARGEPLPLPGRRRRRLLGVAHLRPGLAGLIALGLAGLLGLQAGYPGGLSLLALEAVVSATRHQAGVFFARSATGYPAFFQAVKPPSISKTGSRPICLATSVASAERHAPVQ